MINLGALQWPTGFPWHIVWSFLGLLYVTVIPYEALAPKDFGCCHQHGQVQWGSTRPGKSGLQLEFWKARVNQPNWNSVLLVDQFLWNPIIKNPENPPWVSDGSVISVMPNMILGYWSLHITPQFAKTNDSLNFYTFRFKKNVIYISYDRSAIPMFLLLLAH